MADRVKWLGFLDEAGKERFFQDIDLLAMPSAFESFGMAAAEAVTAGRPVLVSDGTGISEVVRNFGCGWVVNGTEPSLRAGLAHLHDIEERRPEFERMCEAHLPGIRGNLHCGPLFAISASSHEPILIVELSRRCTPLNMGVQCRRAPSSRLCNRRQRDDDRMRKLQINEEFLVEAVRLACGAAGPAAADRTP